MTQSQNNGLITITCASSIEVTLEQLKTTLENQNMHIFATIDHAAGAQKIGADLPPTILVLFGNPQSGTPLMQAQQMIAIDLPQKILLSEDKQGQVYLTYNDPHYLAKRHGINDLGELNDKISKALQTITTAVAKH